MTFLSMLFLLLAAHALVDFPLQTDRMARLKRRFPEPGATYNPTWFYWLGAHAFIHGGAVMLVTGSVPLGALETALHFVADFDSDYRRRRVTVHMDQALHIASKLVWAALANGLLGVTL